MSGPAPAAKRGRGRPRKEGPHEPNGRPARGGPERAQRRLARQNRAANEAAAAERAAIRARLESHNKRIHYYQLMIAKTLAKLAEVEDWLFYELGLSDQRPGPPIWQPRDLHPGSIDPTDRMSQIPVGRFCLKMGLGVEVYDAALAFAGLRSRWLSAWGAPGGSESSIENTLSPANLGRKATAESTVDGVCAAQKNWVRIGVEAESIEFSAQGGTGPTLGAAYRWLCELRRVERYIKATGGAEAWRAIQTLVFDEIDLYPMRPHQYAVTTLGLRALWHAMGSVLDQHVMIPLDDEPPPIYEGPFAPCLNLVINSGGSEIGSFAWSAAIADLEKAQKRCRRCGHYGRRCFDNC